MHDDVSDSIERTLFEAARRNELRIAWVRVVALATTATLDALSHMSPRDAYGLEAFSSANAFAAATWGGAALALAALLQRGWYRSWLRLALPVADGVLVLFLFALLFGTMPSGGLEVDLVVRGALGNTAAVFTLLALSGSLRLTRAASAVTTVLAIVGFGIAGTLGKMRWVETAFVCGILLGAGVLGAALADVARSSVRSEIARIVLGRFLPGRVVAGAHDAPLEVLTKPCSLDATVLVSDLRGFTAYAERRSPEEVLGFLNRVQGAFAEVIRANGGTVDKFLGDGMLAVFGAVDPLPDHAARAIANAGAIVRWIDELNSARARGGESPIGVGVGVHSGPVVVGCLGSGARLEFTIIGDTVNTASRLEGLTKEKGVSVLVSDETANRAKARPSEPGTGPLPALTPLGTVSIRGRQEALGVHSLAREA
jgi:class 3 adenylate cyclase